MPQPLAQVREQFGLKMHIGSGAAASKTEAMCYPPTGMSCEDGDTTLLTALGQSGEITGFVTFVLEFKYLGSLVQYSPASDADANKRIRAAAAFGALRSVLYNTTLSEVTRGQVYTALVLTILLYGWGAWCL
jgi:hypothetical protein